MAHVANRAPVGACVDLAVIRANVALHLARTHSGASDERLQSATVAAMRSALRGAGLNGAIDCANGAMRMDA